MELKPSEFYFDKTDVRIDNATEHEMLIATSSGRVIVSEFMKALCISRKIPYSTTVNDKRVWEMSKIARRNQWLVEWFNAHPHPHSVSTERSIEPYVDIQNAIHFYFSDLAELRIPRPAEKGIIPTE
jgi:hypothetical protein